MNSPTRKSSPARQPKPEPIPAVVSTPGPGVMDEDTAESLAQWAINVVDFRDADSIMTRFEYDPNLSRFAERSIRSVATHRGRQPPVKGHDGGLDAHFRLDQHDRGGAGSVSFS